MQHKNIRKRSMALCLMILLFSLSIGVSSAQDSMVIDLNWRTLTGLGLTEQFVFLMNEDGEIYKFTPEAPLATLDQPVYTLANAEDFAFDPFQLLENPVGPFEAGAALDMSLREYLAARGSGTYTVEGDMATIDISFDRLVPNGVYTLWCSTLTIPPEFNIVDRPCGAQDGSENTFIADEYGTMQVQMSFPALELPTETNRSVIGLAWHSDGETYGEHPGDFGTVTFVPLRALLIPPSN